VDSRTVRSGTCGWHSASIRWASSTNRSNASRSTGDGSPDDPGIDLTAQEWEILGLIGEGLRNPEIAARLVISQATVKTHINNLFTKAGFHSRADAVRYALRRHHTR
jgi:DNA-binding NarL/FixJ family response regulator